MSTVELERIPATPQSEQVPDATLDTSISQTRRQVFLKWLRKTHGWIGLWGAALGLLFGTTGILLNHRAVLKIPAAQVQESTLQLQLPKPPPANLEAMTDWLQRELAFPRPATRAKSEPPKPVAWGDKTLKQPEHWMFNFATPQTNVTVDYWVGNNFATVKRNDNNVIGTLNNLHKSGGVSVGWVLLADTIGGAMILLSITGVLLWTMLNRRRLIGASIGFASLILMIVLGMLAL